MANMPIPKPWRVACSSGSCLPQLLNRRCDGSHEHTPCAGQNTLLTQGYTAEIAKIVHQSIVQDIAAINKAQRTADGTISRDAVVSYAGRALLSVEIDEMEESSAIAVLAASPE